MIIYLAENGVLPGDSGTLRHNSQITHITQITHHAQTKHNTQNYTNTKGHTTHNEYNANKITTTTNTITTTIISLFRNSICNDNCANGTTDLM
jgi:hypothetical protein